MKEIENIKRDIHAAVGNAISTWAEVEMNLGIVAALCLNPENIEVGLRAYYSHLVFEGKLALTDAVVSYRLSEHNSESSEWNSIANRLREKNKNRNKIAHGQIINTATIIDGSQIDDLEFAPFFASSFFKSKGHSKGLRVKELNEIASGFTKISYRLSEFRLRLRSIIIS